MANDGDKAANMPWANSIAAYCRWIRLLRRQSQTLRKSDTGVAGRRPFGATVVSEPRPCNGAGPGETNMTLPKAWHGHCPICEKDAVFAAHGPWLRDQLTCTTCPGGSVPRERALALVLAELRPDWRTLAIHESSPAERGLSLKMARAASGYVASQYFPGQSAGAIIDGFRNEDLENQTFADGSFDLVVTQDVMEHVYNPDRVVAEIFRTLRPQGIYLCTFPVRKEQVPDWERRLIRQDDGSTQHLKPVEIHGNPVDETGSIVTVDYGYELHKAFAAWADFDVRVYRFADMRHGILGENTEVVACWKRGAILRAETEPERRTMAARISDALRPLPWAHRVAKRIYRRLS